MASDAKVSQKIFDYWIKGRKAKSPILFCIVIFLAVLLVISDIKSDSEAIGIRSLQKTHAKQETPQADNEPIESSSFGEDEDQGEDPLIPPENMSRDERMAWFRTQLPNLEILKPSNLSQHFHYRVLNFLNQDCSILFHIIWLSPAKSFGRREFLTLDSFFKIYPQGCLVILSRSMDSTHGYTTLKPLLDRGFKVTVITPDLLFLFRDTPAESWLEEIKSGERDPGYIPLSQNLSNLVRLAMLYKYGGVYMDADILILKDLSQFRNAVGAQSVDPVTKKWTRLGGGVMIFDIHHPILIDFMQEFASTYDGNRWAYNGPYLVSRVIKRVGSTPGYNLTILPPKAFYPVDWIRIGKLLKKSEDESESKWVENKVLEFLYDGDTYAIHLWNKMSREIDIQEGSVIARLISERCVVCDNITNS